jgi:hypothetical protein
MRSTWTDERLDDFAAHTDARFDDLVRRMDSGFDRVDVELRAINARFDGMQRTMIQFGGIMIAALVGVMATQLALILTQL